MSHTQLPRASSWYGLVFSDMTRTIISCTLYNMYDMLKHTWTAEAHLGTRVLKTTSGTLTWTPEKPCFLGAEACRLISDRGHDAGKIAAVVFSSKLLQQRQAGPNDVQ